MGGQFTYYNYVIIEHIIIIKGHKNFPNKSGYLRLLLLFVFSVAYDFCKQ